MAEISTIGNYGKSELPSCMDGRSNPLMDRNVAEALNLSLYIFLSPSLFASSYLSIYLSIYLSDRLPFYLSNCPCMILSSVYLSIKIYLSMFLPLYPSISLSHSLCLSVWLTDWLNYLSVYVSMHLSVYLSTISTHLSFFLSDRKHLCETSLKSGSWELQNAAILRDILKIEVGTSKTKKFSKTASIFDIGTVESEAILRGAFLQNGK